MNVDGNKYELNQAEVDATAENVLYEKLERVMDNFIGDEIQVKLDYLNVESFNKVKHLMEKIKDDILLFIMER